MKSRAIFHKYKYNMSSKPHLFLHFDVNKTIMMADPLRNQQVSEVINETIAESAWGVVNDGVKDIELNVIKTSLAMEFKIRNPFTNKTKSRIPFLC